jgi:hypothetical protein
MAKEYVEGRNGSFYLNGAITFYLGNKDEVERDIAEREAEEDAFSASHPTPPEIKEKFERMRQQMASRRS